MSVAFTREEDLEAAAAHVPVRPLSQNDNLVTPVGLAMLDAVLAAAREAYASARVSSDALTDKTAIALAARDLRYFTARRANARLVELAEGSDVVGFGSTVTSDRDDGRRQTFRIVGEDEADAKAGSVSYVSPLARALFGRRAGDVATLSGGEVEIVAIG